MRSMGKTPARAKDTPGFIVNRVARPFYNEGLRILGDGDASVETIDRIMKQAGSFRMGPFELMDLIGNDVNFAVTRSVWEACYHDPRYAPSVLQQERVAAGFFGRKSGRGYFDYAPGAAPPSPSTLAPQIAPKRAVLHGDPGIAAPLVERLAAHVEIERREALPGFPDGALAVGDAVLALSDGRTATARGAATRTRDLVLFDLALDYAACKRLALAPADSCAPEAFAATAGLVQASGIAVSRLDDVAGLVVMRTVAALANEAADAVTHGIATAADVDIAMQKGVNYPRGPLRWGDDVGVGRIRDVLVHLAAHYGEDRYRVSPLIARRHAAGGRLAAAAGAPR